MRMEKNVTVPKGPKKKQEDSGRKGNKKEICQVFTPYEEFADLKVKTRMLANLEAEQTSLLEDLWKEHTKSKRSLRITNCIILVISLAALAIGLWNLLLC